MTSTAEKKLKLRHGKVLIAEPGRILHTYREQVNSGAVYYIIAGLARMEFKLAGDRILKYYLQPGAVFGLSESVEGRIRISRVVTIEKTMLYRWDLEQFFLAAGEARPLAVLTIKSLSRLIRILNGEYSEQLKLNKQKIESTSEEIRLSGIEFNIESHFSDNTHEHLRHTFQDKQMLIKEGAIQKQVFWILNGEVYVTKFINHEHKILATLGKGELIGEMSFFDKSLTSASIIANGEVQAMVFTLKDFKEIFFTNPKWVKRLLLSLSRRILYMAKKFYRLKKAIKVNTE